MNRYWKFLVIFSLILLGKLSGFFKDVLITFYHGVSVVTDAYFLSNSLASLLYMAVYSAIPIFLVPMYSRLLNRGDILEVNKELSSAISFFFLLSACIGVFVFSFGGGMLDMVSASVDSRVRALSVSYLCIMSATFVFSSLVSFFNSLQTVNKVVIPSYIVPVFNNTFFCIGLYFFNGAAEFDKVLLLGALAWVLLLLINFFISRKSFSFVGGAAFSYFSDKKFMLLFLPAVTAFYIEQINAFVGVYFASDLGVGAISLLSYSNKLNLIFLSVFLVFLTASIFPRIAAVSTKEGQAELFRYLTRCVRLVVILSVPAVIYMGFYAEEIVELLFQRGNFGRDDTVKLASVFSIILIALPFCLLRDIMNRVFFSYGDTLIPVFVSLFALFINASFSYVLSQNFGLKGLVSSVVISTVFNSFVMILLVQRKINSGLIIPCLHYVIISCFCGIVAYLFLSWLHGQFFEYWWFLSIPFTLVYFLLISVLMFYKKIHYYVSFILRRRFA
ncbi:murein biosynthesis integral membrane protein MurJ [Microbulbifer sp. ANSA001]|uniref:murein biosynthesis integral membrane protein MurJ n=1 Tax=Microbulbifer sp. ANSA001 TaxID=3243358 RepID=UPI0040433492